MNFFGALEKKRQLQCISIIKVLVMFLVVMFTFAGGSAEANEIKFRLGEKQYRINGQQGNFSVAPFTKNDSTLVPLRAISEMFGAKVEWIPAVKQVLISKDKSRIRVQIDTKTALINGEARELLAAPLLFESTTMVPIRFVAENLETKVGFNNLTKEISIKSKENKPPIADFVTDKTVYEAGEKVTYTDKSWDPENDPIVDRVWLNRMDTFETPGTYTITLNVQDEKGLWSVRQASQTIQVLPRNEKPVARFSVSQTTVAQGEEVTYRDESTDSDGRIVEVKWTGNQKVFFEAGTKLVTLQVKDDRGAWSEPFSVEINVTGTVRIAEIDYYLKNLALGRVVPLGFNALDLPKVWPEKDGMGRTLLLSNSPETVKEKGMLYSDEATGDVRLLYHHKNGTTDRMKVMILIENLGEFPNMVSMTRKGMSGPSVDDLAVGRTGAFRYLSSRDYWFKQLEPGEMVVLSPGDVKSIPPGQSVYGLFDMNSIGPVRYSFVMVNEKDNVAEIYKSLPTFERDMHNRGTFPAAERVWRVNITGDQDYRLVLGDQIVDNYITGFDALSQIPTTLKGNYGVLYRIIVNTNVDRGVVINPRGGNFAGALSVGSHGAFMTPTNGFLNKNTHGIIAGTVGSGRDNIIEFVPPASSNMPVAMVFKKMPR